MAYTRAKEPIGTEWSFADFVQLHGEYGTMVTLDSRRGIIELGVFGEGGNLTITYISDVIKRFTEEEFEANKVFMIVVVLESGYYCLCNNWEDCKLNLDSSAKPQELQVLDFENNLPDFDVQEYYNENSDMFDGEIFW